MKLISKALRMARVKGITQLYPHAYPRMERAILPLLPAAEYHRTLAATHFSPHRE